MAGLQEQARWENEIYRIEENDPVHGGENGITNKPIKQLANRTKYLKEEVDRRYTAQDASTTGKGIVQLDSSTISNAENKAATPKAVKTAYDNAEGRVSKQGDTMTGILEIDKGDSYVRGKVGRTNKWYVGKGSSSSDDITLWSDAYNSGVTLKSDRTEVTKPLYVGSQKVFYADYYPEASDTRFGLVKLSHKTDGTDRTKAASEYALGEVRRVANQANVAVNGIALTWANVQQKPTTLSGFGITDAVSTNKVSNAVNSTSQTNVGSSLAVKTAYDKGTEAKTTADSALLTANNANANAEGRVSKSGDVMTGTLEFQVATNQMIKGVKGGQNIFYLGVQRGSNDLTIQQFTYGTQLTWGQQGIYSNKNIYVNNNAVYHAGNLPRANLTQAGIARLSSSTTSSDENQAATPKAVKIAYDKGVEAKQTADNALQTANGKQSPATTLGGYGITDAVSIRNVSNAVNSTSQANVASSQAVKTAYDKGVEANNNAQGRVSKSGDTMTGDLIVPYLKATGQYISVSAGDSQFAGLDIIRKGSAGNWLSRIEALPDKRWKFWTENGYEVYVPAKNGVLLLDSDITYQKVGNFEIHRFPSGTMIQTYVIYQNDLLDWREKSFRWAQAFVETPQIFTQITTSENSSHDCGINILTKSDRTSCYYYEYEHGHPNQGRCRIQFQAIGRWK